MPSLWPVFLQGLFSGLVIAYYLNLFFNQEALFLHPIFSVIWFYGSMAAIVIIALMIVIGKK